MSIGIVGLGYVGLPLAMEFAEAGIDVIGVDVDATQGRRPARAASSHIEDVADERLRRRARALQLHHPLRRARTRPTRSSSASRRR